MSENKYYKQIAIASVEQQCKLLGSCYAYYKVEKTKEWEYLSEFIIFTGIDETTMLLENYLSFFWH